MTKIKSIPRLAIILPCYNEEKNISQTCEQLLPILDGLISEQRISANSFLLFVDDGSRDQTWEIISDKMREYTSRCQGLKLSRNFGHQCALLAGIQLAQRHSDVSISIDADLQQDPAQIPAFLACFQEGFEIVYGVRANRNTDSWPKKMSAQGFYYLMKMLGVSLIPNHADYRLLGPKAMGALNRIQDTTPFLRGIIPRLGFSSTTVLHQVGERQFGRSQYTMAKMVSLGLSAVTNLSVVPLRAITVLGIGTFLLSCLMVAYVFWVVWRKDYVPGWASTVIPIYALGGLQLVALGVVGEYLGKIFLQTKKNPVYFIEESSL